MMAELHLEFRHRSLVVVLEEAIRNAAGEVVAHNVALEVAVHNVALEVAAHIAALMVAIRIVVQKHVAAVAHVVEAVEHAVAWVDFHGSQAS
jgi:hypothetical protein